VQESTIKCSLFFSCVYSALNETLNQAQKISIKCFLKFFRIESVATRCYTFCFWVCRKATKKLHHSGVAFSNCCLDFCVIYTKTTKLY